MYLSLKKTQTGGVYTLCLEKSPTKDAIFRLVNHEYATKPEGGDSLKGTRITVEDLVRVNHVATNTWLSVKDIANKETNLVDSGKKAFLTNNVYCYVSSERVRYSPSGSSL